MSKLCEPLYESSSSLKGLKKYIQCFVFLDLVNVFESILKKKTQLEFLLLDLSKKGLLLIFLELNQLSHDKLVGEWRSSWFRIFFMGTPTKKRERITFPIISDGNCVLWASLKAPSQTFHRFISNFVFKLSKHDFYLKIIGIKIRHVFLMEGKLWEKIYYRLWTIPLLSSIVFLGNRFRSIT